MISCIFPSLSLGALEKEEATDKLKVEFKYFYKVFYKLPFCSLV